jgi:hypothetical protein
MGKIKLSGKVQTMKKFLLSILEAIEAIKQHRSSPGIKGR